MKRLNFFLWGLALFAGLSFTACSSSSDDDNGGGGTPSPQTPGDPDNLKYAAFTGAVSDYSGYPLSGVKVTTGTVTTTTDANGVYSFEKVNGVDGRAVLNFSLDGYIDVVRSIPMAETARLNVTMRSANVWNDVPATSPKGLLVSDRDVWEGKVNMTVELPGNYVDAQGKAYTSGNVTAKAAYLNPDNVETFSESMPGDLSAVNSKDEEVQLVSYGMVAVQLEGANGEKLQLAEGSEATLKFPVPQKYAANPPASIPLWSFNEQTGLWEEEGTATLQNGEYIGKVKHFSWHNLDWPEYRATLNVKVVDKNGKALPWIKVDIDGQRTAYTNSAGVATCVVPNNTTMYVRVPSDAYGNYSPEVKKTGINLEAQKEETITLTLPAAPMIKGTITGTGNGSRICAVKLVYGNNQSTKVTTSDMFGAFNLIAPLDYTGAAVLHVINSAGKEVTKNLELTGKDMRVDVVLETEEVEPLGGGQLIFKNEDGSSVTFSLHPIDIAENPQGVNLFDDRLNLQVNSHYGDPDENGKDQHFGMEFLGLEIENYNSNTTRYENVSFNFGQEGMNWMQAQMVATIDVTRDGDTFNFKVVSGTGTINDGNWEKEPTKVTVTGEFSVPFYLKAHSVMNTTSKTGLPAYIPFIADAPFDAIILDECKYIAESGGAVFYLNPNLTVTDFNTVVANAAKTLGEPYARNNDSTDWLWAKFYKNDQYLEILFNPYYQEQAGRGGYGAWDLEGSSYRGKISIRAFNGYKLSLQ
jgi:hypothetical protein